MFTGILTPISRNGTYTETLELTSADDGSLIDLTGAAVTVSLWEPDCDAPSATATLTSGVAVPSAGVIQWRFEQGAVSRFDVESLRVTVVVGRDGDTVEVLNASLPIED